MRTEFSKKVKQDAYRRAAGKCEACGAVLGVGGFHFDHIIPDQLGGEPTLENCQCVCKVCHKDKTREDVGRIAKAKRQECKHLGIRKRSRFPGSRDSRWKKKLDGSVVER